MTMLGHELLLSADNQIRLVNLLASANRFCPHHSSVILLYHSRPLRSLLLLFLEACKPTNGGYSSREKQYIKDDPNSIWTLLLIFATCSMLVHDSFVTQSYLWCASFFSYYFIHFLSLPLVVKSKRYQELKLVGRAIILFLSVSNNSLTCILFEIKFPPRSLFDSG